MTSTELLWVGAAVLVAYLAFRGGHDLGVPRGKDKVRPHSLYLMVSEVYPRLVKVGYTSRLSKTRRGELNGKVDGKLKIAFRVGMPHAYCAEQEALRVLRAKRWDRKARHRGTEWFLLPSGGHLEDVKKVMMDAARRVRKSAESRGSWPETGGIEVFEAGVNRTRVAWDVRKGRRDTAEGAKALRAVGDKELDEMVAHETGKGEWRDAKNA